MSNKTYGTKYSIGIINNIKHINLRIKMEHLERMQFIN